MLIKEIYRPGIYEKDGQRFRVTQKDVAESFAMLAKLDSVGLDVPLVLEHIPVSDGQVEGVPRRFSDASEAKADELRRTVGRSVFSHPETRLNQNGGIDLAFDFVDKEIEDKVKSGAIKLVSPEIRSLWKDGHGNEYRNVPTHIALTHRPIQVDQRPGFIETTVLKSGDKVLALSDLSTGQFYPFLETSARSIQLAQSDLPEQRGSDDAGGKSGQASMPDASQVNPDMPGDSMRDQKLEALIAQAKMLGLVIPSDTNKGNLVERLLTAFMTYNAVIAKTDADSQKGQSQGEGNFNEEQPLTNMQYSDTSPQKKLLKRIRRLSSLQAITPAMAAHLTAKIPSLQFSDSGEENSQVGFSVSDFLACCEGSMPKQTNDICRDRITARIKSLSKSGAITPGFRDQLLPRVALLQFSDIGEEVPGDNGLTMTAVLDSAETSGNQMAAILGSADDTSSSIRDGGEHDHPGGSNFLRGENDKLGSPEAKDAAARLLARTGFKKKPSVEEVRQASQR